jgi:integrase/recombinase XerD
MLSIAALQRLCTPAQNPRHRVRLMTTEAAGLRGSEVMRLPRTDSASERLRLRIEPGQGRQDRSTLLSARGLTARRASWPLARPAPWGFPGRDAPRPMPSGTAQTLS